jgi:hypothetical protein
MKFNCFSPSVHWKSFPLICYYFHNLVNSINNILLFNLKVQVSFGNMRLLTLLNGQSWPYLISCKDLISKEQVKFLKNQS